MIPALEQNLTEVSFATRTLLLATTLTHRNPTTALHLI